MKKLNQRILLVDDDLNEQFLTGSALKKVCPTGSTVNITGGGHEAIAYMIGEGKFADRKAHPFPTVIITDLNMPDGDGFDVLEFVRSNPAWSMIPRIVLSASRDDDDVRTAFLLGASAYHLKPCGLCDLEVLLKQVLEYWAQSEVPPVDENGRLLKTRKGLRGERYPEAEGGERMLRPREERQPAEPSTNENQVRGGATRRPGSPPA